MPVIDAIDISEWRKVYIELAKQSYEGKLDPADLNEDLVRNTYQELSKGAASGYGKGWSPMDKGGQDKTALEIQKNLYKFSCAKSYAQALQINEALLKDGKIQNWNDFKAAVDKINNEYNVHYLNTEYKTAVQASNMAKNWKEYTSNKNYKNLKYKTQGDSSVRDEHAAVNDVIAPIDSPFWLNYYPPNGWNCRCYVEQTNEPATDPTPTSVPKTPDEFKLNVGISGQIFSDDRKTPAPYFALARADKNFEKAFEFAKYAKPTYNDVASFKNGSSVAESIFAHANDVQNNIDNALLIAKKFKNTDIGIRPHIEKISGWKNPEYNINGLIADLYNGTIENALVQKTDQIKTFIKQYNKQFKDAQLPTEYSIVINTNTVGYDAKDVMGLARLINGRFIIGTKLNTIYIINNGMVRRFDKGLKFNEIQSMLKALYKK